MITFHALFARKHGSATGYPVIAVFGEEGLAAVLAKYNEITNASSGASFRAAHAEVQLIQNLDIVAHHEFPDPAMLEKQRVDGLLAEARRVKDQAANSMAAAKAARAKADADSAAFRLLSPEHKQLLADAEAAEAKAAREAAEAAKAAQIAESAEQKRMEEAAKVNADGAQSVAEDGTAALVGSLPVLAPEVAPETESSNPPEK